MANEKKLRDQAFGRFAEDRAADFYISEGYAIRERNWKHGRIEIDIIAQKENVIVFVEVKGRSGRDNDAADAVTNDKMRRMTLGADFYLRNMKGRFEYRYDIFTLTGDFDNYEVQVYPDAFISPLLH